MVLAGGAAKFPQGFGLDLPDAFAGHGEFVARFLRVTR